MAVAAVISMIIMGEGVPRAELVFASQRCRRPAALGSALHPPRTPPDC